MPGHADVHMSTVPEALYLCGSKRGKGEQDNTGWKTKEEAGREGNLQYCTTYDVRLSKLWNLSCIFLILLGIKLFILRHICTFKPLTAQQWLTEMA